jgi:hypothetical protein
MPHFKCVACRARLYSAAGPDDVVGEICPGCGSLFEPVDDLAEIVGFRAIKSRDSAADDAGRWLDDGGSFGPDAVADAIALPTPENW